MRHGVSHTAKSTIENIYKGMREVFAGVNSMWGLVDRLQDSRSWQVSSGYWGFHAHQGSLLKYKDL